MLTVEVYQFIPSTNMPNGRVGTLKTCPQQRPDITLTMDYELCDKPFEINFAQVVPTSPSIGAHEPIDPYVDTYMQKRWPRCIKGLGRIATRSPDETNSETIKTILLYLRSNVWFLKSRWEILREHAHHFARVPGYRRVFFYQQLGDIERNRRPSSSQHYAPVAVGEYCGPGVSSLPNISPFDFVNELVWSPVIPFLSRTLEIRKHYNSYNELHDAKRFLDAGEIKACVRSGASAVDAILHYYSRIWDVPFPPAQLPFDEKIEHFLKVANRPSYRAADSHNLLRLLYLYRARNSMHEGDCYYKDAAENKLTVGNREQAAPLVEAAEDFTLWMDSIS